MRRSLHSVLIITVLTVATTAAWAQDVKERIRIFSVEGRPLFGLQMIQSPTGLETHLYKFNDTGAVYEVKLNAAEVIQGFSETVYVLSPEFKLVIPSGTDMSAVPTLLKTVAAARPAQAQQPEKTELAVDIASEKDIALIRTQASFVSTPPVRYQSLSEKGRARFVIQTNKVGDTYSHQIFGVSADGNVKLETIASTVIGFSNTVFHLESGATLDLPTMPGSNATLVQDLAPKAEPQAKVLTTELTEVPSTEELNSKIHIVFKRNQCRSMFSE